MSDTVKLIIEISKDEYKARQRWLVNPKRLEFTGIIMADEVDIAIAHGIPLDDVKNKILDYNVRKHVSGSESFLRGYAVGMDKSAEILDNIGKAERR